jgi:hypothetical protein
MAMAASRVPVARRIFPSRMFMGLVVIYALTARVAVYEYMLSKTVTGIEFTKPLPAPLVKLSAKIRQTKTEFLSLERGRCGSRDATNTVHGNNRPLVRSFYGAKSVVYATH